MAAGTHNYDAEVVWTGNRGQGTSSYRAYDRTWDIATAGKPIIHCSNDPKLGGDPSRPNPEDLLIASLSACHMLWYLHLASDAGIVVHSYADHPVGVGFVASNGAGKFERAILRPTIEVSKGADLARAHAIHHKIHEFCFIARSVSFPISYEPTFIER